MSMFTSCIGRCCSRFAVRSAGIGPQTSAPRRPQGDGYRRVSLNKHCKEIGFLLNVGVKCKQ